MKRAFAAATGLLVLSLGFAYYASLPVLDTGEGKEWYTVDVKAIKTITFEEPNKWLQLKPLESGFWIDTKEKKLSSPSPSPTPTSIAGQGSSPSPTPTASISPTPALNNEEPKELVEAFRASERVKEVFDSLKPLMAHRVLGPAAKLELSRFGLDKNAAQLTIEPKTGEPFNLTIGKRSYGSRNFFALDNKTQTVILIEGTLYELLNGAKGVLFERRILGKEPIDVKKVKILAQKAERTWVQADKDQSGNPSFRDEEENSKPKAQYASWLESIFRLRTQHYATDEELKAIESLEAFLTLNLDFDKDSKELLSFYKVPAHTLPQEAELSFWAKSTFSDRPVKVSVSRLTIFESDLESLMGGTAPKP